MSGSFRGTPAKLTRYGALGAGLLAAALALTSCAGSTGAPDSSSTAAVAGVEPRNIGYVDLIASGPMQMRYFDYFKAGAESLGWTVQLQDAKGDPTRANTEAVNLLNSGIDALVVSCADTAPMAPALKLAKSKGIPAVQVGCPMSDDAPWDASYPIDDAAVGEALGAYVAGEVDTGAQVGILGDTTILAGAIRTDGILEGLAPADIDVVGNQSISLTDPVAATRTTTQSYLTANPDLAAILAVYDFFAPPAGDTVKAAGRADSVGVYSFFADAVNVPYMLTDGSPLRAVVDGPVEQVSLVAVDQLLAYFEKDTPFDASAIDSLDVTYEIFTIDNLPEYSDGYITPYPVDEYLAPYLEAWSAEYGAK